MDGFELVPVALIFEIGTKVENVGTYEFEWVTRLPLVIHANDFESSGIVTGSCAARTAEEVQKNWSSHSVIPPANP